jgi:RNA-directed DNA polymerase
MAELLGETAAFGNLLQAWQVLQKRLPSEARCVFGWRLEDYLLDIGDSLVAGTWTPYARPVGYHPTDSGKSIPVPRLIDRLVLLALKQTLQPRVERFFIHDTYAGRPGRGVQSAVERAMTFQRRVASPDKPQSGWLLKADVRHFYPSLRHSVLLDICRRRFRDAGITALLSRYLAVWSVWSETPGVGIPLGSSLSCLLANLYLDPFDHWVKDELGWKCYLRYADDMLFLHHERAALTVLQARLTVRLVEEFALTLNARKTEVRRTGSGVDFLGYRLFYYHCLLRRKNMGKIRRRLGRFARAYAAGTLYAADIRKSLAGWLGYARFADTYNFRRRLFGGFRLRRSKRGM